MDSREGNQRPISRQSYSGYRSPIGGGRPSVPERRQFAPGSTPGPQPENPTPQPSPIQSPTQPALEPTIEESPSSTESSTVNVHSMANRPPESIRPVQQPAPSQVEQPASSFQQGATQQPSQPIKPLTFEAPPKPKKNLPKIKLPKFSLKNLSKMQLMVIGAVAGLAFLALVIYGVASWQASRSDPLTILNGAFDNHLKMQYLEAQVESGSSSKTSSYDLTDLKAPQVSTKSKIQLHNKNLDISTYGSNKDTFIRYDSLPQDVDKMTASSLQNRWIKLRDNGKISADTSHTYSSLADPRVQLFGPIMFGNYDNITRKEITGFLSQNKVYKLEAKEPKKATLDGKKVIVLPVVIDAGYLKVVVQSAALKLGYAPDEVAEAVRALDAYKGSKADIYISSRGGQILKAVITDAKGAQHSFTYKPVKQSSVEPKPRESTTWKEASVLIWKMESQLASKAQPQMLDLVRKTAIDSLMTNLASYRAQKGFYPTLANVNDLSWLSGIPLGAAEMQKDPVATSLVLSPASKPGSYAYAPAPSSRTGACDNIRVLCTTYTLTAIMSDGKPYTVKSP